MDRARALALEALALAAERHLGAHETLGWVPDDPGAPRPTVDYVYVQGRGDRLHAFRVVATRGDIDGAAAFATVPANWRWVAFVPGDAPVERGAVDFARSLGVGCCAVTAAGDFDRRIEPSPNPGTFIREYPELRARWRTISSW